MHKTQSLSLADFLNRQATRSFRNLMKLVNGTTAEQSIRFRSKDWPDHTHGIGQDGSIAGIIYHVAAWKELTLPIFDLTDVSVTKVPTRSDFQVDRAPERDDWPGLVRWLDTVGTTWLDRLYDLPPTEFLEPREWEGVTISLADYVTEMLFHDVQHASQIEYIHQRLFIDSESERAPTVERA